MHELAGLTGRWWDWQVDRWDATGLRLIADNDLTYHHSVEVRFSDVVWVACAETFHHPVFRSPTADEQAFGRMVINDDGYHVFTWDAETASGTVAMMVVAGEVRVDEALIRH